MISSAPRVLGAHRCHIIGNPILGGAEPAHRLGEGAKLRSEIVLTVPVAECPGNCCGVVTVERTDGAARHRENGAVDKLGMVSVSLVLGQQFPIGTGLVLEPTRGQLHLPLRRKPCQSVEFARSIAEVLEESGSGLGETAEHEALIDGDAGHSAHAEFELVLSAVPLVVRVAKQLTGIAVRPPVVRAPERTRIPGGVVAHEVGAVGATVEQQVYVTGLVPGHDDVL